MYLCLIIIILKLLKTEKSVVSLCFMSYRNHTKVTVLILLIPFVLSGLLVTFSIFFFPSIMEIENFELSRKLKDQLLSGLFNPTDFYSMQMYALLVLHVHQWLSSFSATKLGFFFIFFFIRIKFY
jgi:hypothetical protein